MRVPLAHALHTAPVASVDGYEAIGRQLFAGPGQGNSLVGDAVQWLDPIDPLVMLHVKLPVSRPSHGSHSENGRRTLLQYRLLQCYLFRADVQSRAKERDELLREWYAPLVRSVRDLKIKGHADEASSRSEANHRES